jgi:uncharacterized protein (DUF58 family)
MKDYLLQIGLALVAILLILIYIRKWRRCFTFFKSLLSSKKNESFRESNVANSNFKSAVARENTKDTKSKLRKIAITTRKLSNQVFAGSYHSAFKGKGISFSEVREYQYGDDVRLIDWNVTARDGKPFVKVFDEERELTLMLIIDVSNSTLFGTQNEFKKDIIEVISGILAFSAITNNDKVGVLFFSNKIEKYIPPKKGKSHIMRIITEIENIKPTGNGTAINTVLEYFNNANKKKTIAFLISDFQAPINFEKQLSIAARKHDLLGIQVYDKAEHYLADLGIVKIEDAENGASFYVDTSDKAVRKNIQESFEKTQLNLSSLFTKSGAQFVSLATTDDYVKSLIQLFKERGLRKR